MEWNFLLCNNFALKFCIGYCTNSVEQSPSSEASSHSDSQKIPQLLWNPKIHYCVHSSLPLAPILSHMNPVCILISDILILSSHLCLSLPNSCFPSGFPSKILYTLLISLMHAVYPIHVEKLSTPVWSTNFHIHAQHSVLYLSCITKIR